MAASRINSNGPGMLLLVLSVEGDDLPHSYERQQILYTSRDLHLVL
jgi:hypothetical protein